MNENYTIIWSFRNRFDVLKRSIETADLYTPKDVDFCLVDAASSEETIKKLREYCNTIVNRTVRICEATYRTSLSEAWNLGMMLTNNRYVVFSSSDVEFLKYSWFLELKDHREQTQSKYILINNHAVFLIDKTIIPKIGWFDEDFVPGPHFDCDYMIRASEQGVKLTIIGANGGYIHIGEHAKEDIKRSTNDIPDRLPMNDFRNEDYFKSKWQSGWPGWRNYINQEHKPHPPVHITSAKRLKPEIDPHPIYTKKYR